MIYDIYLELTQLMQGDVVKQGLRPSGATGASGESDASDASCDAVTQLRGHTSESDEDPPS